MKILEIGHCPLSNVEVCSIVRKELADIEQRFQALRVHKEAPNASRENALTVERQRTSGRNVIEYLERCYPIVQRGKATEKSVNNFLASIADLGGNPPLTDAEVVQILNLTPADEDMICFHGFVRDSSERFDAEQVSRLRNLIQYHLLGTADLDLAVNPSPTALEPSAPSGGEVLQATDVSVAKPAKAARARTKSGSKAEEQPASKNAEVSIADIMAASDEDEPPPAAKSTKRKGSRKMKANLAAAPEQGAVDAATVAAVSSAGKPRISAADAAVMSPRKGLKRDAKRASAVVPAAEPQSQLDASILPDSVGGSGLVEKRAKKRRVVSDDD